MALALVSNFGNAQSPISAASIQTPAPDLVAAALIGALPKDYKEQAKAFVLTKLKDPGSAQFQPIEDAQRFGFPGFKPENFSYAWKVTVVVNAKNSYGGYSGFERFYVFFRDGEIVEWDDAKASRMTGRAIAEQRGSNLN